MKCWGKLLLVKKVHCGMIWPVGQLCSRVLCFIFSNICETLSCALGSGGFGPTPGLGGAGLTDIYSNAAFLFRTGAGKWRVAYGVEN